MSVEFSGWEVVDDGASFPGVALQSSQRPQNRGVYKMFHGTTVANARLIIANGFKRSKDGMLGEGVYVSRDIKKASRYPLLGSDSDRVIFQLRVRVGRVKRIDSSSISMQKTWHKSGYDTAWVPPNIGLQAVPSGLEEDCVYDPKRVTVTGIAKAPTAAIQTELEQLIAKKGRRGRRGSAPAVCSVCKRKTQQGAAHVQQKCWKCGHNICILKAKHFCCTTTP
ncbi:unnamed protein product [Ophioblennius macclurei]